MRTAVQSKAPRGQRVARPYTFPVPTKGWMANENLAAMPEDAAYVLENFFPEPTYIRCRNGSKTYATLPATTDAVPTVMVYEAGSTTNIFAAQNGNLYDVTDGGTISETALTDQSSDYYVWSNFATSGGNFLVAANGTDDLLNFDGTDWTTPTITGVTSSTIFSFFQFKSRLFLIPVNSSTVWFLPPDSIAGTAQPLALGGELTLGGSIIAGCSMLIQAATGPGNYAVFLSSEGEVVVYAGTDPSSSDNWALVGVFRISRPVGKRCMLQIGGDVAVLCADGVVSLVRAIQTDLAAQSKAMFSDNIRTAFSDQYAQSGTLAEWQIISWPTAHMAIVNIPIVSGEVSQQYVMNVLSGAWAKYTGMNASCFALAGTKMYFGSTDGKVIEFESGADDDGTEVNAVSISAFSPFRAPGFKKYVRSMQVFCRGTGNFLIGANLATEFVSVSTALSFQNFLAASSTLWDVAEWDVDVWSDPQATRQARFGISGAGYYMAPAIFAQTSGTMAVDCQILAMNLLYEQGNVIG